ncbi:MAG: MATE family efflux transporter [Clostridia bacterium]
MEKILSEKDIKKREMILSGNMWYVVICISGPLAIYQWMQQFFRVFDTMIAAQISPMSVSAVSYLTQISSLVTALGTGLAIGSCIKISEAYGAAEYEDVHLRVNELFKMCMLIAIIVIIFIPFSAPLLKIMGTPNDFIVEGSVYFSIILVDCAINLFSTAYIAMERVRGNSGRILKLNLIAFVLKLALSMLFVFGFKMGVSMMAVASVLSDLVVFSAFIYHFCIKNKGDIFSISSYNLRIKRDVTKPMLSVSYPVIAEKVTFQFGKYIMSAMAAIYGSLVSGALGISNTIGGMITTLQTGFQDAGASIISQNVGAGNKRRSLDAFYKLCTINIIIGIIGYLLATGYLPLIASFFDGGDPEFSQIIQDVYIWEAYGSVPLGVFAAASALLYGYGYTKLTLILNFSRLFILRIPVLWFFQNFTELGTHGVGICMGISNGGTGVLGGIVVIFVIMHLKKEMAIEEANETSFTK